MFSIDLQLRMRLTLQNINTAERLFSALEGVRQASLFEELNAATPSWTSARLPGSNLTPTESGKQVLSAVSSKTKDVLSSLVEKSENSSLPPSLILNLVNCKFYPRHPIFFLPHKLQ